MKSGYIDTSFLLSIIFQDENYKTSVKTWNDLDVLFSSILLEIEARINIYKYYVHGKNDNMQYKMKNSELNTLLEKINRKTVDQEILLEIKNTDKLKRPRSLDSIHLATANIINKLTEEKLLLCTYDKNMSQAGEELGMLPI
jgi:predicted nucleic acid-binding protein